MKPTRRLPTLFLFALLSVSLALPACATVQPVLTKVEGAVDCNAKQIKAQLPSIIATIATDLLSQDYAAFLTSLAAQEGDDIVICGVQASAAAAASRAAETPGALPNQSIIQAHASAYLSARGVVFAADGGAQ